MRIDKWAITPGKTMRPWRGKTIVLLTAMVAGAVAKAKVIDDTPVRQAIIDLERD